MVELVIIERRRVMVGGWRDLSLVRLADGTYVTEGHDLFGDYERIGWPFTGTLRAAYDRFEDAHRRILAQYGVRAL